MFARILRGDHRIVFTVPDQCVGGHPVEFRICEAHLADHLQRLLKKALKAYRKIEREGQFLGVTDELREQYSAGPEDSELEELEPEAAFSK